MLIMINYNLMCLQNNEELKKIARDQKMATAARSCVEKGWNNRVRMICRDDRPGSRRGSVFVSGGAGGQRTVSRAERIGQWEWWPVAVTIALGARRRCSGGTGNYGAPPVGMPNGRRYARGVRRRRPHHRHHLH